ncbi:hypothetical protein NQ315_008311 [Exocentrus adspersus]|uniref:Uncharacterized protein n=1 Tax=Exocentrus adspersus TaxID=1586481 RepID=A0AAV8V532_9CUCU|nr:hypothetical protein NQ315_008311 [Exocentrus adspersus]
MTEIIGKMKGKICLEAKNGVVKLKRTHRYYYQIQGQLNIARKQKCYFIVTCIAPEMIRKNIEKRIKCVDPLHIVEAIRKFEEKKQKFKKAAI